MLQSEFFLIFRMRQGLKYIRYMQRIQKVVGIMREKSLDSYREWSVDIGTDHPLSKIRVYHILSPKECQKIIDEGERMAARIGGWLSKRHKGAPTTDIPFHFLGGHKRGVFGKWQQHFEKNILGPILRKDYNAHFSSFNDFFLVTS